jgi:hypothetical protein
MDEEVPSSLALCKLQPDSSFPGAAVGCPNSPHPWQDTVIVHPIQGQGGMGPWFSLLHLLLKPAPCIGKGLRWHCTYCFSINHPWILRGTSSRKTKQNKNPSILSIHSCRVEKCTAYSGGKAASAHDLLLFFSWPALLFTASPLGWTVQGWKTSKCWILPLATHSPRNSKSTPTLAHLLLSNLDGPASTYPFSHPLLISLACAQQIFTCCSKLFRLVRSSFFLFFF